MSNCPGKLTIVPLAREHAPAVAALHISGIHAGFISSLGPGFVTALYEGIAESEDSFGFVALIDGRVSGFVSLSTDVSRLYKTVLKRSGSRFFFLLCWKMVSLQTLKKILETLFYPRRVKGLQLPEAEFLSMSVAPEARFFGLGPEFIRLGLEECRKRGISEVKILAAETLQPINKMYRMMGFQVRTKVVNHGVTSNIYVIPTDFFSARKSQGELVT